MYFFRMVCDLLSRPVWAQSQRQRWAGRVWGRHSPTRFPQGQNERRANFGTSVESCSEKLRRSPAPVLSANKTVQEGISARSFGISRNFSCSLPTTPLKTELTEILRNSPLFPTTPRKPEKADNGSIFSLIPSTDRKRILPTAAAIFPFAFSYWGFSKTPNGNEKKQQIR